MNEVLCETTSKSTGQRCQQPERWLEERRTQPNGTFVLERQRVCQAHGRMLERRGWRFVRELHPVPGFERIAEAVPS